MAILATHLNPAPDLGTIATLALADGCATHPVIARLTSAGAAGRDLADAVHALCSVHGRLGDLFEQAAQRSVSGLDNRWMMLAIEGFASERAYLAHLTAAVGPLPSTPGQAASDAAFAAQRHTFDMLARSDRAGCAIGAALALVIDWQAFRRILDAAAARVGAPIVAPQMPDAAEPSLLGGTGDASPAVVRAIAFGAQQTFAQHRGLCDLIEARAIARDQL
ncbi:hypothetical protein U1872_05685 [Sphingomonas sp. RB3P16]|uniref:DUF6975 family protein n=1 Tax=Parasphingomonas frigoris TaxID=3096163 RepID=UPI002FCA0FB7